MNEWHERRYKEAKLAYVALMKFYPFTTEDLEGEVWRDVTGYEGLYQISTFGRVKSFCGRAPRILKPICDAHGYLKIGLYKNGKPTQFFINRLVAIHFIENIDNKLEVDHKSGIRLDNYVDNLRWVTHKENIGFSFDLGLSPSGYERPDAKLTYEQCVFIRENPNKLSSRELAELFGVGSVTISEVQRGKTYKNVQGKIRDAISTKIPDDLRKQIRAEYKKGIYRCGVPSLALKYGLGRTTVQRIVNEK